MEWLQIYLTVNIHWTIWRKFVVQKISFKFYKIKKQVNIDQFTF